MRRLWLSAAIGLIALGACSKENYIDSKERLCDAGETEPCYGAEGCRGDHVCRDDGQGWQTCVCRDAVCAADERRCVQDRLEICSDDGTEHDLVKECAPGTCDDTKDTCPDPIDGEGGEGGGAGTLEGSGGAAGRPLSESGGSGPGGTTSGGAASGGEGVAEEAGGANGGVDSGQSGGSDTGGAADGGTTTGGSTTGGFAAGGDGGEAVAGGGTTTGGGTTSGGAGTGGASGEFCGNGALEEPERCDDGDRDGGDGCDAACRLEPGYTCPDEGAECVPTVCGNGDEEPGEGCDDGNQIAGDGCGPTCAIEPTVTVGTDPVVNVFCGDGMVTGAEECDDGNSSSGDGCSETCEVEDGYDCEAVLEPPDSVAFRVTYRDFKGTNEEGGHPHMKRTYQDAPDDTPPEMGDDRGIPGAICTASNQTTCGRLNSVGNPQLAPYADLQTQHPTIYWHPEDFDMWYGTTTSGTGENGAIQVVELAGTLTLARGSGESYSFSSSNFFPLDGATGSLGATPDQGSHNFHFTTTLRYFFEYQGGENLTFTGDDDIWVYINGRLAVDIGGIHSAEATSVTLASGSDARFGTSAGNVYEIVLFHAERNPTASNFNLTLAGFLAPRSVCTPR